MTAGVEPDPATRDTLAAVWGLGSHARFEPLGNGLIHRTLLVSDGGRRHVVQCLNTRVFREPALVIRNCLAATTHLGHERAAGHYNYAVLELVPTLSGKPAAVLPDGSWWRMCGYLPDTLTFDTTDDAALAFEAGRAFGAFAAGLSRFDTGRIGEVIPHFHDPVSRFDAFRAALAADRAGRAREASSVCDAAFEFAGLIETWQALRADGLPWRITHNDCKLNNLLFDRDGHAVCVVDLDTVMPGSLLFDFGDIARSMLSPIAEDSTDLDGLTLRHHHFAALARGYVAGCGPLLTPLERDNLAFAPRLMSGMLGLRFLTDYLDGDRYFRTTHPAHNLERARNQFALYNALTAQADTLQGLVPGSA